MDFNKCFLFDKYSENASMQFDDTSRSLRDLESSFHSKMNGKTVGGLFASFVGTVIWLAIFKFCGFYARNMINNVYLIIAAVVTFLLLFIMLLDNFIDLVYCEKITSYKNLIVELKNVVRHEKDSLHVNTGIFLNSRASGWNLELHVAPSVPSESRSIASTMSNIENIQKGFLFGAKNFFFFSTVIVITIVGCIALFPTASEIFAGTTSAAFDSISSDVLMLINIAAMIIAVIGVTIIAKFIWSKTDCNVTNLTLFVLLLGPILFIALVAIVALVVLICSYLIAIIIALAIVAMFFACVFAATSGG